MPPEELYHVDREGLAGGLGRALVVLNYPFALGAIALAALAAERLPRRRLLAWVAIALCAVTALPGVVDEGDLDARLVNVVPAVGVALALALTFAASRSGAGFVPRTRGDTLRLVLAGLLLVLALPWAAADWGFQFPGDVFMGEEVGRSGGETLEAVHLGHHHGGDGVILALTALALSRVPLRPVLAGYLSLMLVYGVANAVQDGWNEQLVKRGTLDAQFPTVLRPELSWPWLAIVLAAAAVHVLWLGRGARRGLADERLC